MKFYTTFSPKKPAGLTTTLPSETVPDQSMTIQEIIARFVRSGSMPVSIHSDIGDNEAFDPEFDPLDQQPAEIISQLKPEEPKAPEAAPQEPKDDKEPSAPSSPAPSA